jgi:nitrite transporter NirC
LPAPLSDTLSAQETSAADKAKLLRRSPGRYLLSSVLAGGYVGIAVVLLLSVAGPLVAAESPAARLVQGAVFGIALTLVVFAGAELFTGVVMVALQGLTRGSVRGRDVLAVCAAAWVGNLAGSLGFAALVWGSGVVSTGPAAALLDAVVTTKAGLSGGELFLRAVLCNLLVCLGLWMAARATSDGAKLVCLWWALLAFIASGFEHCVANMTVFGLGMLGGVDAASAAELARNLVLTTAGNVVGGGVLVGLAYSYLGRTPAAAPAEVPVQASPVAASR